MLLYMIGLLICYIIPCFDHNYKDMPVDSSYIFPCFDHNYKDKLPLEGWGRGGIYTYAFSADALYMIYCHLNLSCFYHNYKYMTQLFGGIVAHVWFVRMAEHLLTQ